MAIDARLEHLDHRHSELETALEEELRHACYDENRITEIKRQKLRIKDEMRSLEARRETSHAAA